MADFYGELIGKGRVTKCGTKSQGLTAKVNGWRFGVEVRILFDEATGEETATIYLTGGTGSPGVRKLVGRYGETMNLFERDDYGKQ